jgi:hypothetical protein
VDNLAFDGLVFGSFLNSFDWDLFNNSFFLLDIFHNLFLNDVGDVLSDVLHSVVVGDLLLSGDDFGSFDGLVFSNCAFFRNHFSSLNGFVLNYDSLFGDLFRSDDLFVFDDSALVWDLFGFLHGLILDDGFLVWDVFNSRLGLGSLLNNLLLNNGSLLHVLDSGGLLNVLDCGGLLVDDLGGLGLNNNMALSHLWDKLLSCKS